MKKINTKKLFFLQKNKFYNNGFGLVDAILSLSLLAGIITYGIYFSSLRLTTVQSSNLIRSISKEIERDIERLKLDLWSMSYDKNSGEYTSSNETCSDFSEEIINLPSWVVDSSSANEMIQSWRPGEERSKVFSGGKVLITRELNISPPINNESLNNSIATLNYRVQWGENNKHWLSIDLTPEAHSWCEQII